MKRKKNNKGFTLLETLFAIFIVIIGFFSVFNIMRVGIGATTSSINRLIAANLAQEAFEIIRNMRDSSYDVGDDWSVITDPGHLDRYSCLTSDKNCRVDMDNKRLLDEDTNAYLKIDANNKYQYSSGENSGFKRWVNMTQGAGLCAELATSSDCIQINVGVGWQEKGREEFLETEGYLYAWY